MNSQFFSLDKASLKRVFHHGQQYWTQQVNLNSLFLRTDNSLLIELNHYRFPKENEEHAVVIDEVSGMIIDYQLHQESVFFSLQNQQIEWVSLIGSPNSSSFNKGHNKKMIIPKEGLNHQYWEKMPKKETPSSIYLKRKLDRAGKMTIRLVTL